MRNECGHLSLMLGNSASDLQICQDQPTRRMQDLATFADDPCDSAPVRAAGERLAGSDPMGSSIPEKQRNGRAVNSARKHATEAGRMRGWLHETSDARLYLLGGRNDSPYILRRDTPSTRNFAKALTPPNGLYHRRVRPATRGEGWAQALTG